MYDQDRSVKLEGLRTVSIHRPKKTGIQRSEDYVVREEPLEIRLSKHQSLSVQLAITMRTPGDDEDLIVGFLYSEGIIQSSEEITSISIQGNIADVKLSDSSTFELSQVQRRLLVSSSCGICGKKDLNSLEYTSQRLPWSSKIVVDIDALTQMSQIMKDHQELFSYTGGTHAAGLFSTKGQLINLKEDIGRHNALDKLIGSLLQQKIEEDIICVSGRTSFELVQKVAMYGASILLSVGPASHLAIQSAEEEGITLIGFLSDTTFNIYCGSQRIKMN